MNRAEILIEALKECNRREEVLYSRYLATGGDCGHTKAADISRNITDAIAATLAEKETPHDSRVDQVLDTNTQLGQKLQMARADLDAEKELRAKADMEIVRLRSYIAGHAEELSNRDKNPALENVLAKLRAIVPNCSGFADSYLIADSVTLGDLRRWVESEVKK